MDFSERDALRNFKFIYPDVRVKVVGPNRDDTGLVIATDDGGYHTITDTEISQYFTSKDRALSYTFNATPAKSKENAMYCGKYPVVKEPGDGYIVKGDKSEYDLLEGISLGDKYTSDAIFIMDVNPENWKLVGWIMGATFFETDASYRADIGKIIEDYEKTGKRYV